MSIHTHAATTPQARRDCAGITSKEQDLRRHSAAENQEDVSLQTHRVVVVAYRDKRKLFCQHLTSRLVDEGR